MKNHACSYVHRRSFHWRNNLSEAYVINWHVGGDQVATHHRLLLLYYEYQIDTHIVKLHYAIFIVQYSYITFIIHYSSP